MFDKSKVAEDQLQFLEPYIEEYLNISNSVNNIEDMENEFIEKMEDPSFRKHQKRRAQTEARIGIFKNSILDGSLYERNIENKQMKVAWAVLAHNLWCIARLPQLTGSNTEAA